MSPNLDEKKAIGSGDNPYRSPEPSDGAIVPAIVTPVRWCSIASLMFSIASIVVHAVAMSIIGRAITASAAQARPLNIGEAASGLDGLGLLLLIGSLLAGIPAAMKDARLRIAVIIAFVVAAVFSFLLI
jgi:hypothetical protein